MQDPQNREARVEADEVGERQRAHRVVHAELHDPVHRLRRRDALVHREERLVQHREEDAVRDEAGKVAARERGLSHLPGEGEDGLRRLVRRRDAADHLDERHDGHGIHEVHADEAVRPLRARREPRDRDGRRVRREDRRGRDEGVEPREEVPLDGLVLDDRLDDEAGVGEPREVGRRGDARERRVAVAGRDLALLDLAREVLLDRPEALSREVGRHVDEHDPLPGERRHVRDARTHLSGAHDANRSRCHRISFSFVALREGSSPEPIRRRRARGAARARRRPRAPRRSPRATRGPRGGGRATGRRDRSPRRRRPAASAAGSPNRRLAARRAPRDRAARATTKTTARPKIFAAASAARRAAPRRARAGPGERRARTPRGRTRSGRRSRRARPGTRSGPARLVRGPEEPAGREKEKAEGNDEPREEQKEPEREHERRGLAGRQRRCLELGKGRGLERRDRPDVSAHLRRDRAPCRVRREITGGLLRR